MSKELTKEDILDKVANDHSYNDWGEAMYDTHPHTQIEYAGIAMGIFANQEKKKEAIEFMDFIEKKAQYLSFKNYEQLYEIFLIHKESKL